MSTNLSSSEDEAPEEVTFSSGASEALQRQKERQDVEATTKRIAKEKHRARDNWLKSQSKSRKESRRKLLSEVLNEEMDKSLRLRDSEQESHNEQREKKVLNRAKPTKFTVDGIEVQLMNKVGRQLPPATSSLVKSKERFLQRRSIRRR